MRMPKKHMHFNVWIDYRRVTWNDKCITVMHLKPKITVITQTHITTHGFTPSIHLIGIIPDKFPSKSYYYG